MGWKTLVPTQSELINQACKPATALRAYPELACMVSNRTQGQLIYE